jgi:predicted esterase
MMLDITPPTFASAEPAGQTTPPLLIAFHSHDSSVEREINDYRVATETGWRVVMPQSVQALEKARFVWDNWEITTKQVARDYQYLVNRKQFDTQRIVTAGIGDGAAVAFWSAASRTIPACGVILISNSNLHYPQVENLLRDNLDLRIYLMINGGDEAMKQFADYFLRAQGIVYKYEVYRGMAEEFPSDFDVRLKRALEFITEPLDIKS